MQQMHSYSHFAALGERREQPLQPSQLWQLWGGHQDDPGFFANGHMGGCEALSFSSLETTRQQSRRLYGIQLLQFSAIRGTNR